MSPYVVSWGPTKHFRVQRRSRLSKKGTNAFQGVQKEPEGTIGILGGLMGAKMIHGDFIGYSGGSKMFSEILKCS